MKIYISMDMEGIPGTYNWEHEKKNPSEVKKCIHAHLQDVIEAIIQHPKSSEIDEITIADSHSAADNVDYEFCRIDKRVNLISGSPRPSYMMPLLTKCYDMVFLVGYHAGTGAIKANMDHTYSNSKIQKISINGKPMNEALINAAFAGCHDVPVAFVSGDLALYHELKQEDALPKSEYLITKEAVSKFAAKSYNPLLLKAEITNAITKVLDREAGFYDVFRFTSPISLEIEFHSTAMADLALQMPNVLRKDGKTIVYSSDDYLILFGALEALITLAYGTGI